MNKEATLDKLKAVKCRSAWSKGVKEYAYMLLDNIFLHSDYKAINDCKSLHRELLHGKKIGISFLGEDMHCSMMKI